MHNIQSFFQKCNYWEKIVNYSGYSKFKKTACFCLLFSLANEVKRSLCATYRR